MEIGDKYGIIEATVIGIISGLVKTERIRVPGQPQVKGINPNKIHIYFDNSPDVITNRRTTDQEIWEIDKRLDGCNFFGEQEIYRQ